ncbi:MAG: LppP/LprE family lipoprotein [Gordonia paraffinivorans]
MTVLTRRTAATMTLAAAVSLLAACGSTPQATPERPTVTVTSTATGVPASTGTDATTVTGGTAGGSAVSDASGGPSDECAADIGPEAAAARDVNRIPPPSVSGSWRAYNAGGTWCRGLSWVEVSRAESQTPIRPHQLLIYHDGHFQGTAIRCEARYGQYILATAPDAITVQYSYLDPTNPAQQRSQGGVGKADVTFRWDGSHVVMDGSLPYAFTEGKC